MKYIVHSIVINTFWKEKGGTERKTECAKEWGGTLIWENVVR